MLTYLRIRNFGIFHDIDLELGPGLTVFTGETGAGKSMIVDAVMACLGYRTSSDVIRSGEERAVLDLLISPGIASGILHADWADVLGDETEIAVQRDILPERSYMRINGRVATMSMAQSMGSRLVDIHGQQDHHSLLKPQAYLSVVDSLDKEAIGPVKARYHTAYARRQEILSEMEELSRDTSQRKREIDLLSYQIDEIDRAELKQGEEEALRQEHRVLVSQRRLMELAQEAYERLYDGSGRISSAYEHITQSISLLSRAAAIDPAAIHTGQALEQVLYSLEIALDLLRDYQKGLSLEPSRLKEVEGRLDLIERLKAKYGSTVEEVLGFRNLSNARLKRLLHAGEILSGLEKELAQVENEIADLGAKLTCLRRGTASMMEKSISSVLQELGMPGGKFSVVLEHQEDTGLGIKVGDRKLKPFADGFDRAGFLFSANPGEPPLPLYKVASGGELSRLMLAIKSCLEEADPVPTLIFDEIDAGVGGKAGQAIGEKLWQLGRTHQVLCVTHLASIAAMADTHFAVSKAEKGGRTYGQVTVLTGEDKAREIARMLSGTDLGVSLDHGRELIAAAKAFKESFEHPQV
ncbi:MAG: DNA repair protein RecN [Bacillota bacterium]